MPSFDGRRFTWPKKPDAHGRSDFGNWGEGRPCARCGCAEREHEDVQAKFGRFLAERDSIPLEALHWSHLELALWADTEGVFRPGSKRTYCADETKPGVLVSVICPTTGSRSCFHPFLWHCFEKQEHAPRELVVIDTSEEEPSAFFEEKARSDSRLLYKHFRVPEKKWCIGLKRNLACYLASGDVIAHFDDDDMYGDIYLETMLRYLRLPKLAFDQAWLQDDERLIHRLYSSMGVVHINGVSLEQMLADVRERAGLYKFGAACVKFARWNTYTLRTRKWGLYNAVEDDEKELYGWGFCFVYLRSAWLECPFSHMGLGEDYDFVRRLRQNGQPVVLLYDENGICAHTVHLDNTSGGNPESPRRYGGSSQMWTRVGKLLGLYEACAKPILDSQESYRSARGSLRQV
uniref:Glycosyltransferase 2-like domain-containing protein n=1 Tax=Alexandrium catenella TaxID=2925 RepID=A0A7S1KXB0_ALECA